MDFNLGDLIDIPSEDTIEEVKPEPKKQPAKEIKKPEPKKQPANKSKAKKKTTPRTVKPIMKNPYDKYGELMKMYEIPLSLPQKKFLTAILNIENIDHRNFLKRYRRNRQDFDLCFSICNE